MLSPVPDLVLPMQQPHDADVQRMLLLLRSGRHWLLRPRGDELYMQPAVVSGEQRCHGVPLMCCCVVRGIPKCHDFIWLLEVPRPAKCQVPGSK